MKKISLVLAVLLLASTAAFADTVYDNSSAINTTISSFGNPNTATYGETFSAPVTDTTLNSFSLFLNAGASGPLQGYIGTWTGTEAGTILYTSAPVTATGSNQQFTFNTGGLNLTSSAEYVAFISISGAGYNSFSGATSMPADTVSSLIPGGAFVYINNGSDTSLLTSGNGWTGFGAGYNVQFVADFSAGSAATPEPGSLLLFGTGLLGLGILLRRKIALQGRM